MQSAGEVARLVGMVWEQVSNKGDVAEGVRVPGSEEGSQGEGIMGRGVEVWEEGGCLLLNKLGECDVAVTSAGKPLDKPLDSLACTSLPRLCCWTLADALWAHLVQGAPSKHITW